MNPARRLLLASIGVVFALASTMPVRAATPDDGAWLPPPDAPPAGGDADPILAGPLAGDLADRPPDVYLVTETYAGDEIVRHGAVTTYRTLTVSETPGTYARLLDTVPTGVASAYDGAAFNGRAMLSDGRLVAGTYYETLVLTDTGFVPVSIVFFQDDSELAMRQAGPAAANAAAARTPSLAASSGAAASSSAGSSSLAIGGARLAPAGSWLERIEVVRGRTVELWFGVRGGDAAAGRDWRVVSAEGAVVRAASGAANEPLRVRWDQLAPPGAAWRLVVAIAVGDAPEVLATVDVVVRSPALGE